MDSTRRRRVWAAVRLGTAVLPLAVVAWALLTRGDAVLASHPSLALLLAAVALVGVALLSVALLRGALRDLRGRAADATGSESRPRPVRRLLLLLLALVLAGSVVYLRPYQASPVAVAELAGDAQVEVRSSPTRIVLSPRGETARTGLVFHPGALVDPRAYLPPLSELARRGYLVEVVKEPLGVALLSSDAVPDAAARHPEVRHWAVGGHSLGGVRASTEAAEHPQLVAGLLLWASYPLGSLRDADLAVTSVYGSADAVAPPAEVLAGATDLPEDTRFVEVPGGVHAYFGDYGPQRGDGQPTTTREAARAVVVDASAELLAGLG